MPMPKVPQELPIVGKFLNTVVPSVSSHPHVALPVHNNRMLGTGAGSRDSLSWPARNVIRSAPGFQQVAIGIKFQNRRRWNAAIGTWRRRRCAYFVRIGVSRAAHHPNVIVYVGDHYRNALAVPLVGQWPRPEGIDFVYRYGHVF